MEHDAVIKNNAIVEYFYNIKKMLMLWRKRKKVYKTVSTIWPHFSWENVI